MQLEFAKKEAQRRTEVLGTSHFVLKAKTQIDGYLITTLPVATYEVVAYFLPQ